MKNLIFYLLLFFTLINCQSQNSIVVEKYSNGRNRVVHTKNILDGNDSLIKITGYRENGSVSFTGFMIGDKLDSTFTQWFNDADQISTITNYERGKKKGPEISWYINGNLKDEINYFNDKKHGAEVQWYENKNKKAEGSWEEGKQVELWTYWYENGMKKEEGEYKGGEFEKLSLTSSKSEPEFIPYKHGRWVYWNEKGEISRTEEWEKGNLKDIK